MTTTTTCLACSASDAALAAKAAHGFGSPAHVAALKIWAAHKDPHADCPMAGPATPLVIFG